MDKLLYLVFLFNFAVLGSCRFCDADYDNIEMREEMAGFRVNNNSYYKFRIASNVPYKIYKPSDKSISIEDKDINSEYNGYWFLENSTTHRACDCDFVYICKVEDKEYMAEVYSSEPFKLSKNNLNDMIYL